VQPTLGVRQNGKWDYTVIPHLPHIRGHRAVGDHMRAQVAANVMDLRTSGFKGATPVPKAATDKARNRIRWLQRLLVRVGHPVGVIDGIVGPNTTDAARAFAESHDVPFNEQNPFAQPLVKALREAEERMRREPPKPLVEHLDQLAVRDRMSKTSVAAGLSGAAGFAGIAGQAADTAQDALDTGQSLMDTAMSLGPWVVCLLLVIALAGYIVWNRRRDAVKARESEDYLRGLYHEPEDWS